MREEDFDPKGAWLTGPPNDDVDSDHLYNAMFYGIEDARYIIFHDWLKSIESRINPPRKCRPYGTGNGWGISHVEGYLQIKKLAWKLDRILEQRSKTWTNALFARITHYFSEKT